MNNANRIRELTNRIKQLEKKLNDLETKSYLDVEEYGANDAMLSFRKDLKSIDDALSGVLTRGALFAKGGKLEASLNNASQLTNKLLGSTKPAVKAFEALTMGMQSFGQIAETDIGGISNYSDKMIALASTLKEMGLSYSDFIKNQELATYTLDMNANQVARLNQGLVDFAKEVKMLPSVVSQNFQLVAKAMAYNAPMIQNEFQKIQKLSAQTGVSVGSLMSGFGQNLDTLSGASSFAGKFNAIMGRVVFSPNEVLMMSESERMMAVRNAIQTHPIYSEIKAGGKLGVFALDTIRGLTGYDRETARRFILYGEAGTAGQGPRGDSMKGQIGKKTGQLFDTATAAGVQDGLVQLGTGITTLVQQIKANSDFLATNALGGRLVQAGLFERRNFTFGGVLDQQGLPNQAAIDYAKAGLVIDMGTGFDTTLFGGGRNAPSQNQIAQSVLMSPFVGQMLQTLQTLPDRSRGVLQTRLMEIIGDLTSGNPDMPSIQRKIAQLRTDVVEGVAFRDVDRNVSPIEFSFVRKVGQATKNFGLQRDLLRFFRESEDNTLEDASALIGTDISTDQSIIPGMSFFNALTDTEKIKIRQDLGRSYGASGQNATTKRDEARTRVGEGRDAGTPNALPTGGSNTQPFNAPPVPPAGGGSGGGGGFSSIRTPPAPPQSTPVWVPAMFAFFRSGGFKISLDGTGKIGTLSVDQQKLQELEAALGGSPLGSVVV